MDTTAITLITAGIVAVIGAIATGIVTVVKELSEQKINQIKTASEHGRKLDNITVLVDGRYSEVLKQVASLQEVLASVTGKKGDKALAEAARETSDNQELQLEKANKAKLRRNKLNIE